MTDCFACRKGGYADAQKELGKVDVGSRSMRRCGDSSVGGVRARRKKPYYFGRGLCSVRQAVPMCAHGRFVSED